VLTDFHFDEMLKRHSELEAATIGAYKVPDPSRCGIVQVDPRGGWITEFTANPKFRLAMSHFPAFCWHAGNFYAPSQNISQRILDSMFFLA